MILSDISDEDSDKTSGICYSINFFFSLSFMLSISPFKFSFCSFSDYSSLELEET